MLELITQLCKALNRQLSCFQLFPNNPVALTQPSPGMESKSSTSVNIQSIKQVTDRANKEQSCWLNPSA